MFYVSEILLSVLVVIASADSTTRFGCPNGEPIYNCFAEPCAVSSCPAFPGAECRDDYCGGCKARYYVNNQEVTAKCRQSRAKRQAGCPFAYKCALPYIPCPQIPCANQHCPAHPSAVCCNYMCGGTCTFSWWVGYQDVTGDCWNVNPNPQGPLNPTS